MISYNHLKDGLMKSPRPLLFLKNITVQLLVKVVSTLKDCKINITSESTSLKVLMMLSLEVLQEVPSRLKKKLKSWLIISLKMVIPKKFKFQQKLYQGSLVKMVKLWMVSLLMPVLKLMWKITMIKNQNLVLSY